MPTPVFRPDLYAGTAPDYDRFRLPYPQALIDDLAGQAGLDGAGRLLDLACGTGQVSFALHGRFAEVWAVDQEPDMTGFARRKAQAAGITGIRFLTCAAEELSGPDESFDLVTIGNAFHRLRRDVVAALVLRWLRPGRFLALLWGGSPGEGDEPWQQAMSTVADRWKARIGNRVPAGYQRDRSERPDQAILGAAGFEPAGRLELRVAHEWTAQALIGHLFSTSVLSRAALGDSAAAFDRDLRRELHGCEPSGRFRQTTSFACDLARRPEQPRL